MNTSEILIRPIITERASTLTERFDTVVFEVMKAANKNQIKDAVEQRYGVRVTDVRTTVLPGKLKRRGTSVGKRPNFKKAFVKLQKGDTIDFFGAE